VSPGKAPRTNTALPSLRATPRPSCVRPLISTSSAATSVPISGIRRRLRPLAGKLEQVRALVGLQPGLERLRFLRIGLRAQIAANEFEAQPDEIGIERVGFAVVANL